MIQATPRIIALLRQCRNRRPFWQQWAAAALLILGVAASAQADTAAGIAALRRGAYITAIAQLEPPARAGDALAQVNLAGIYHYGLGIAANFAKAHQWYRAAALQDDPDGEIGLAVLYAVGQGVPVNLPLAHMWLTVALDGLPPGPDRERVRLNRDGIAERMTAAELKESTTLVQAWYLNHRVP
jgi:hypothetical protein